jgi:hypothetical protein
MRKSILALAAAFAAMALFNGPAGAVIPGVGVISKKNVEWKWNNTQAVGSDIEFLERKQADGSLKRYAIAGAIGSGFNIIDITNPAMPLQVGAYVSPHAYQGDVQVNPRRNIVVLSTDLAGSAAHSGGSGIEFVDITNLTTPSRLGLVSNVEGAHNATIIDDSFVYTVGPTFVVDYSDPRNPKNLGKPAGVCPGHDITVDPNQPNIAYAACGSNTTQILDVSNPAAPAIVSQIRDTKMAISHQSDPSPDSSLLYVGDERGGGVSNSNAPGGGLFIYDISGKYTDGAASLANPIKIGYWVAPYSGPAGSDTAPGQWGNVTSHVGTFQAERFLVSIGWYTLGSWVTDLGGPTLTEGGLYNEWSGNQFNQGPTTWGNTTGNILLEGDEVWSTKWTRFDDPLYDRYMFTNGLTRGVDTLLYTGPLPKKVARLTVSGDAPGGAVTGVLDRYAVWTYTGWENRPLADKALQVSAGGTTVEVTTGADGSFSASTGLLPGTYEATVTWAGDDDYQPASVTQQITVS